MIFQNLRLSAKKILKIIKSHKNHINHHISVENRENIYLIDLRFIIQEYISISKTAVRRIAGILSRPNPSAEVNEQPEKGWRR